MGAKTDTGAAASGREFVITRVVDAPRELVWRAWVSPDHVGQWWGPNGFTTTTYSMDVREGGVWHFTMHGPDGVDYPNRIHYIEVVEPERLVYRHAGEEDVEQVTFETTVTFEDAKGRTRITIRMEFPTVEERERVMREHGALEGVEQTLDRLSQHVMGLADESLPELVITRVFDAPRELVWRAWTEAKHLGQWWGPHQFTNPVCEVDVRPGGAIRIDMRAPDGTVHPMTGEFQEVMEPERLVFTSAALDQDDREMFRVLTTVTFESDGGKTRLTMHAEVLETTPEAAPHLAGMEAGWTQSLERLADRVASMRAEPVRVRVSRIFDARPERVFDAWLDPEVLGKWMFGPSVREEEIVHLKTDPRVGGTFSFLVRRGGAEIDHVGMYRIIDRPNRLAFTWGVAGDSEDASLVTVEFRATPSGCALTLSHEMAATWADFAEQAQASWSTMLDALAAFVGRRV